MKHPVNVTLSDIIAAKERIAPYIKRTPLKKLHDNVYLKAEHEQVVKSFKPRGACNAMLRLTDEEKKRGVITRSSGNFAQGVSYIGKELGVKVTIVMPEHAPKVKVESTKNLGARVILKGSQHYESEAVVTQLSKEENLTKMHPYDHNDVIAGQGTAMLEICEDLHTIDIFFCQISGGGLMAGCATALRALQPNALIIGVEPEGASDYAQSRAKGEPVTLTKASSIADGMLAPTVGDHCRPLLDAYVNDVVVLSEAELLHATQALHARGECLEPSGAAAYAGYLKYKNTHNCADKTIVCMGSGGNYDTDKLTL